MEVRGLLRQVQPNILALGSESFQFCLGWGYPYVVESLDSF